MSDWELAENPQTENASEWEATETPISKMPQSNESFGTSLLKSVPRIGEDLASGGYNFVKNIPNYYQTAKKELPGLIPTLVNHPGHAALQALAGSQELINNLAQLPKGLAAYGEQRLNLVPHKFTDYISKLTPEDTSSDIKNLFGDPTYPGESLIRGATRNALNIYGVGKLGSVLNPMNLTAKNIAKDILNTADSNKKIYGHLYKNLWNEAENKGFGDSLYNVDIDTKTLKKFSPKNSIQGVIEFSKNPTLQNAHAAKSDLLRIQRDLNKLPTLRNAERQQLKAVSEGIDSLQGNMFKDTNGNLDQNMLNKYNQIQQGYANEVIPYKNKHINKFKRKELSANELVNALSRGEFAAKRGKFHPELGIRNVFKDHPYFTGAGLLGLGTMIYKNIFGNPTQGNQ